MLERIRELEEERRRREQEEKRQEAERAAARQRAEEKRQLEAKEYARFVRETNRRILHESGVISALQEIERGRLRGTTSKHALIVDVDGGQVTLVWGSKFTILGKTIDYEKPFLGFGEGVKDYSHIDVSVNDPNRGTLRVNDSTLSESDWRDRGLLIGHLAEAYLHPRRVTIRESDARHSSSSSTTTECCNQ